MNIYTKYKNKKNNKKNLEEKENKIKNQWKTKWENELHSTAGGNDKYFTDWLLANLDFLESGIEWNRAMNFRMKGTALAFFVFVYVAAFCLAFKFDKLGLVDSIVLLVPSYVIYKWIGVRKYQETWSRYMGYRSRLIQEMSKYLYGIAPYGNSDDRKKFIENIIGLTGGNVKKFQNNMETKEENLFSQSSKMRNL